MNTSANPDSSLNNDHVLFKLDNEYYSIRANKLERVIPRPSMRKVPNLPAYISGIIDYEEQIVPVINMKIKMNLNDTTSSGNFILLFEKNELLVGLLADTVVELKEFSDEPKKDLTYLSEEVQTFTDGTFRINGEELTGEDITGEELVIILSVEKIYNHIEKELSL